MNGNDSKPVETIHVKKYYVNGAHAGNISFHVAMWGPNGLKKKAEIAKRLDEVITQLFQEDV